MAGRFCASFDTETSLANLLLGKWNSSSGSGATSFVAMNNGNGFRTTHVRGISGFALIKNLGASATTFFKKFHFRASVLPSVGDRIEILSILDSGTPQVTITLQSDGTLAAYRGSGVGTLLGTSSGAITAATAFSISVKTIIDASAGAVVIKIGSTTVLNLTGINTKATGTASSNGFYIGNISAVGMTGTMDYDDIQVNDASGSVNNTFPDPGTLVGYKLPTGAGSNAQFTPDSGSNYARVNEANPDGDTSYVEDGNVGDRDTYAMAPCPGNTGPIAFVQMSAYAKLDSAGSRSHANTCLSGGTYADGASNALNLTYTDFLDILEQDPHVAAAWTKSALDAAEFGSKVAA